MITIPGYRVLRQHYQGNRTVVYQGHRTNDKKPVVIKAILSNQLTPENINMLRHEYDVTRNLDVDGVVRSYGIEDSDSGPALILEDFGGVPLKSLITPDGMKLDLFLDTAIQLAKTLGDLHQNHIVHRDIKPSNIIINPDTGQVKITDFGISTLLDREISPNMFGGSLAYMSPEQTGRMNRVVDYRTDFYSIGVCFYEACTGQLPFQAADAMEWVHCHIAKLPVPPRQVNPTIPQVVSEIIMKLLAKTAEERYQGDYGLRADLERCRTALHSYGKIEHFVIGQDDRSDKFQISQKLYGREKEIDLLMASFDRARRGSTEMVLISGYAGIGKSSVVLEVHKRIVQHKGYFISGKFDQFQSTIPYSCFIQAFQDLVRQLLTESEETIALWKKRLTHALDKNGQVIIDVIPEVKLIVDEQPAVRELPPAESQNRFHLAFQSFISVFAHKENPLVIFMDDLQWADLASLKLTHQLITSPNSSHLLLIGAYRNNEVSFTHPLKQTLDDIEKAGTAICQISLGPLNINHVNALISDTLARPPEISRPLADLVAGRTGGNPLYINEVLKALYDDSQLTFNVRNGSWQWDLRWIARGAHLPEDLAELIVWQLKSLPPNVQKVLSLAACIGNQFTLHTLSTVNEKTWQETAADLWVAMQEGFIVADGRFLINSGDEVSETDSVIFKFIHDRVQQAASSLIEEGLRKQTRLRIGRLILKNTAHHEREERVFEIVNQLNYGIELITTPLEKKELAWLNLLAGKKAIASNAFSEALRYLTTGTELLPKDPWNAEYEMTSALKRKQLECEYLCGNFDKAEQLFGECLINVRSRREKADIYNIKIILYTHQGKYRESVALGRQALKMFGVYISAYPGKTSILLEYAESRLLRIWRRLAGRTNVEDLYHLPDMTDPDQLAVMSILSNLPAPSYYLDKNMFALVNLKMLNSSLRYGNTDVSSFAYATYGMILSGVFGDFDTGFKFGELALQLNEKYDNVALRNKPPFVFYTFVAHWKRHAGPDVDALREIFQLSLTSGDLVYAANTLLSIVIKIIAKGNNLDNILEEVAKYDDFLNRIKDHDSQRAMAVAKQMVLCLKGLTWEPSGFSNDDYDEATQVRIMKEKNTIPLHWYYMYKLQTLSVLGYHAEALVMAIESDKMLETSLSLINLADHYFHYSLVLTSLYPSATWYDKMQYRVRLRRNERILKTWSDHCPENFLHKYLLVSAEWARLFGTDGTAVKLYEQAAQSARENGYIQNEAICNELASRFYRSRGIETAAKAYVSLAYEGYLRWGATAKVRALEASFPDWFREQTSFKASRETESIPTFSTATATEALDMVSVIKASQAISEEIHFDRLLERLMKIVMENAGARRGLLILEQEGKLYRVAEGTADSGAVVLQSVPLDASVALAESVVHYTARTQKAVVLDDAANEGLFIHDPYIINRTAKSILCTPIIKQGRLSGLLYLENDLTTHAFTPGQVGVLETLSAQIANSLENARLYKEARQAKESLLESELKFRTLAETMRAAVVIYRLEKFLYVNPAAESMSGFTSEEFLKMDFSKIVHRDYLALVQERERARWQGLSVPAQYEIKIVTKNGGERWVMGSAGLIEFEGQPAAIGALLDITDYKEAEEERVRLHKENVRHYRERIEEERRHQREKENILMDIHDGIGGLATNIGLLAEVAQKATSPIDVNKTLSRISSLSREGMAEIRNLMYSLDSKDLSWHTLIAELKNLGSKTVEPHGIFFEMTTEVKEDTTQPNSLLCLHLFRIYREALTNIVKHAHAKKVTVNLLVISERLVVTVCDDGQGFNKTASARKGRGMNNMTVRAAEMGGSVTITGNQGTCITIKIPL